MPVFRQIVEQIAYMIETGQLDDGERLPSSRMLADNLHVNRNTVARAYGELGRRGLVHRQGRHGMVVLDAGSARARMAARNAAHDLLAAAVESCLELGLAPDEIASLAYQHGLHAQRSEVRLAFVECNAERAQTFAAELGVALEAPVTPLVLAEMQPGDVEPQDLVVTTFFHLAEVRRIIRALSSDERPEVLGIVVGPHLRTLARLSLIPEGHRIGIFYTTEHQAELIRQSLRDAGIARIDVIVSADDPQLARCDLVIVPSESPELAAQLDGRAPLLEFGNELDGASIRMVAEVVDELRERKAQPATANRRSQTSSAPAG